ncbi:unnamed protein product [Malus baccata var. baccata]
MSSFTNEIEWIDPPRGFTMPRFISYKGDEDPDQHLKYYRSTMILYRNNDALMCKIFATTLQGEAQDWFHTLPTQSIRSFNELSFVFTKEHGNDISFIALWDEAKQPNKNESEKKHIERSSTREESTLETFTKFTVSIGQILCKLKNEPWFELPPPMKDDLTRLDHTKYCAFYQGSGYTTNGCLKWKQYLEKLTNEGRCDEYLDRSTKRHTQAGEVPITP